MKSTSLFLSSFVAAVNIVFNFSSLLKGVPITASYLLRLDDIKIATTRRTIQKGVQRHLALVLLCADLDLLTILFFI